MRVLTAARIGEQLLAFVVVVGAETVFPCCFGLAQFCPPAVWGILYAW